MLTIEEVEGKLEEALRDANPHAEEVGWNNLIMKAIGTITRGLTFEELAQLLVKTHELGKIPEPSEMPKLTAFETIRFNINLHLRWLAPKVADKLEAEYKEIVKALTEEGISVRSSVRSMGWNVERKGSITVLNSESFKTEYEAWMWAEKNTNG